MKILFDNGTYEVSTNGDTLWFNTHTMLGRISPRGSDVHVDSACVAGSCTPGPSWDHFVEQMKLHHGIDPTPYKEHLTWIQ
jgi:hypothetical protein